MQSITFENNLSETVFLVSNNGNSDDSYDIRWFSPFIEIAFCGLAPLWSMRLGKNERVTYQASKRGGVLDCMVAGDRVLIFRNAVQYLTGFINV
ncbi:PhzF family phenazine biosynthesis protein [uncultured Psychrobacter sp.]|uniref:PhzF family phenazine biosynthesis protein n=1 Tax=uncultured Psychrobacter sp. TaxID=259303 RepID=UPI003459B5B0